MKELEKAMKRYDHNTDSIRPLVDLAKLKGFSGGKIKKATRTVEDRDHEGMLLDVLRYVLGGRGTE